jgi:hypothetical protein
LVAGSAGLAVTHCRQPVGDHASELGNTGAQFGDRRLRLRFDQGALALPLLAFLCKRMTKRVSPSLKQVISM